MTLLPLNGRLVRLHGANLAWLHYGSDIGGGPTNGGVSTAAQAAQLDYWFGAMQSAGMNTCRWMLAWGGASMPISVDANNLPSGINPTAWPDLDAALNLAWKHGLALDLCIFDHPETLPASWRDDSAGRDALVKALGTMVSRYAGHPNILAWELGNEWDNRMLPPTPVVNPQNAKALIGAFSAMVHSLSRTQLVTMSNGGANQLSYFVGLGLDFYQPHWYDNGRTDDYNVLAGARDAAYYTRTYGLDKPIVVGEFSADVLPGLSGTVALDKYRAFARKGYAGAWGWSASPGAGDNLRIDWAAAARFAAEL